MAEQLGNRKGTEHARQFGIRESTLSEIRKICGAGDDGKLPLKAKPGADQMPARVWVFNRQHNGLGNQLFEFIWSRLLSESLGSAWATSLLEPERGESPWNKIEFPPNSENGHRLFRELFQAPEVNARGRALLDRDVNATAPCLEPTQRCTVSDRPWDQKATKQTVLSQMIAALYSDGCARKCLFTIGYFQEPVFMEPFRAEVTAPALCSKLKGGGIFR